MENNDFTQLLEELYAEKYKIELKNIIEEFCIRELEYSEEIYMQVYSQLKNYKNSLEKKIYICIITHYLEYLEAPPPNLNKLKSLGIGELGKLSQKLLKIIQEKYRLSLVKFEISYGEYIKKCFEPNEL